MTHVETGIGVFVDHVATIFALLATIVLVVATIVLDQATIVRA